LVVDPGSSRERLAGVLSAAFAEGLLSEETLSYRLGVLFGPRLVNPQGLVGDLALRPPRKRSVIAMLAVVAVELFREVMNVAQPTRERRSPLLLTLDWSVQEDELVIGRAAVCDIVLEDRTVSRRHARLACRDGTWIVHDLDSTNGTFVNGATVGRCQLRPGDRLCLGDQAVDVD
jgi:hypothetical protein